MTQIRLRLVLICLLLGFYILKGQAQETDSSQLLLKGIYLENLDILIPWKINFSEIEKYGNPQLSKNPSFSNQTLLKWDSVKIFDGLISSIETSQRNRFFKKEKIIPITFFRSWIDSSTAMKLISFFNQKTGHKPTFSQKKSTSWRWIVHDCFVHIFYQKEFGYWLAINRMKNCS